MGAGSEDGYGRRPGVALGVAALILVSGWGATVLVVLPLRAELHADAERGLEDALADEGRGVAALVAGMRDVAAEIARQPKTRDLLEAQVGGGETLENVAAATRPELEAALRRFPGLLGISRHGPRGAAVAQVGRPIPASPWPIPARMLDRAPEAAILRLGNRSFLAVSAPITGSGGERIGTDVLIYDLDPLQNLLARVPEYSAGGRYILGGRERERWWDLMLPPTGDGSNAVVEGSAVAAAMDAAARASGLLRGARGEARGQLLAYGRVPGQPWVLVLTADGRRLYAGADRRVARHAAPGLAAAVVLAIGGWLLVGGRLTRAARRSSRSGTAAA